MLDRQRIRQLSGRESAALAEEAASPSWPPMFRSTHRGPRAWLAEPAWDPLFSATVDATEEAVLNALWSAERTEGRQGRVVEALPHDAVLELLAAHRRLER